MKRNVFSILFFLKKGQPMKNGEMPVCLRINVNRQRAEIRTRRSIDPKLWCQAKERSRGRDRLSQDLNHYIETSRVRLYQIFEKLEREEKPVSAKIVLDIFNGKTENSQRTLLGVFKEHNEQCRQLIGIDYVAITVNRYDLCCRYLGELISKEYHLDDLPLKEIDNEFIRKFELYLKTERGCAQNTVIRYMKAFKKVINLAIANDWISRNPFAGIRFHEKEVVKEVLTKEELQIMIQKELSVPRLELVRDVFIFCTFTGLAFVDVSQLKPEHVVKDTKGKLWIRKHRQKTKNICNIPLLEIPQIILDKYKDHPICKKKGVCLPVMANQKMNSYLKEISDLCGIEKNISTHTARHTFATQICLSNDVPMETVSKMLGHSSLKMTQLYAKVIDTKISKDMDALANRIEGKYGEM